MNKESERWFAQYLIDHGYNMEFEPELDGASKPDYLASKLSEQALCEVKEFETAGIFTDYNFDCPEVRTRPASAALRPVRNQIDSAARQLREYRRLNFPLIIVLANPQKAQVTLSDGMVIAAMFGDPSTEFTIDENGKTQTVDIAGLNGAMRNNHKFISGVVVLEQISKNQSIINKALEEAMGLNPEASSKDLMSCIRKLEVTLGEDEFSYKCTVFENDSSECVPIPDTFFNGNLDRRYRPKNGIMRLI